jgi:hypothetical protein
VRDFDTFVTDNETPKKQKIAENEGKIQQLTGQRAYQNNFFQQSIQRNDANEIRISNEIEPLQEEIDYAYENL